MAGALERRLFYIPSFKIYGGVAGLYDFGPPGCAVKANLLAQWRQHFVLHENMLEIECPAVTPEVVLKTSGHVEKFIDLMVKDVKTQTCFRADHLLEDVIEPMLKDPTVPRDKKKAMELDKNRVDEMSPEELGGKLKEYGVKAPDTGNDLTSPFPFNLMFATQIGPMGNNQAYFRPETAQGIFVNFRDLLYYNGGRLPFAGAQVGRGYRNEIAPRQGLLRVREFEMAEIEHFVHPEKKVRIFAEQPASVERNTKRENCKEREGMREGERCLRQQRQARSSSQSIPLPPLRSPPSDSHTHLARLQGPPALCLGGRPGAASLQPRAPGRRGEAHGNDAG